MQIFGLTIAPTRSLVARAKNQPPASLAPIDSRGGWWPIIREFATGAWQKNLEIHLPDVLTFGAVYSCITLIASDIGKGSFQLVREDSDGICTPVQEASPFKAVLRKPNRYQTRIKFFENWLVSKLAHGNTYILKERDKRGIVTALYILDPRRCRPLVAEDGAIYYQVDRDTLSSLQQTQIVVPAREIIHDVMVPLYHPLVGVTPIYACGLAAVQGLHVQRNSAHFFGNGSIPGGVLTAPGAIGDETAKRLKDYWDTNFTGQNAGKVAVLGDGLKYEPMTMSAVDAQLIEQLRWTAENVCTAYHVPPYMIGVGPAPNYNNIEALNQQYYTQTLQNPIESIELLLKEGLEIPDPMGIEFDVDALLRMDTATKIKAAGEATGSGCMSPNEARKKYFNLGPVKGGDTPFMQQQNWPIDKLASRAAPSATTITPKPGEPGGPPAPMPGDPPMNPGEPPANPGDPPAPAPAKGLEETELEAVAELLLRHELSARSAA